MERKAKQSVKESVKEGKGKESVKERPRVLLKRTPRSSDPTTDSDDDDDFGMILCAFLCVLLNSSIQY